MNEYIVPHIQIRRKRHDPSKEKFPHSNPNPAFNPDELSEKQEYCFDSITVQEIVNSERDYMVVGDLGIGKTSLLLWIAKQVCSECENAEYIPLFIQIKDVSQIQTRDAFFSLLDTRYNLNKYDAEGRRFLFLLDGLDQIGKYGNINNSLKHKDVFGERNKIILTTRPIGYEWIKKDLDPKYEYLQIQLLDNKKIKEYVGKYYNNEDFQAILSRNNDLLSVPILLKMVKTLLLNDRLSEIKNRTSLYTTFISYLFEKWERDKKGESSACTTAIRIQEDLARLSYEAIANNHLGSFPLKMGYEFFRDDKKQLDDLTSWSVTHNLVEKEGEAVVAYTHQSFQEYLAAIYLKNILCRNNRIDQDILEKCLEYKRWDETVVFTVGLLDEETAKALIKTIRKYDLYLAGSCLGEYKGIRSEFKGLIDELLKNIENEEARHVLIKISDSELIEKLITLLNTDVGRWAADVLGEIGSEKAIKPLISILKDSNTDKDVRRSAAYALGKIGSETAVKPLISILKDTDTDMGRLVVDALGEIRSEKAIKPLISILKYKNTEDVCESAAYALGKIGSEKAVEPLISVIKDKDADMYVHESVADALGRIGSEKAVKPLISILENSYTDKNVRRIVADALGKIGSEKTIEPLISILKDSNSDKDVRKSAAYALGKIGSEKAVKPLISILKNIITDNNVRKSTAYALGEIGSETAVEPLIAILKDSSTDKDVRRSVADALGEIGSEKAIEPLISIFKVKDWYVGRWAAYALGKIGSEKATKPLISILKVKDWYVGRWAANALGVIGSKKAVEPLISILKNMGEDTDIHERAAYALGKIGSKTAVKSLISIINNNNMDTYVRWIAGHALCEITKKLKEEEQNKLIVYIYSPKFVNDWKNSLITQIKNVTARRFIKISKLARKQMPE